MLHICITADHELFSGENFFGEDEVFIEPTYRLMEAVEECGATITIMNDVMSLIRHRQLGMDEYVQKVEKQLVHALKNGHDVQLHIHPHWMNSTYDGEGWDFDLENFRIHGFGFDESSPQSAGSIIRQGKRYLENLLSDVKEDYECIAFRAGGLCIQPEAELVEELVKSGILIDSSIFKGGYALSPTHYFDFRKVPDLCNWRISPEKGITVPSEHFQGTVMEVPIGSYGKRPGMWVEKIMGKRCRFSRGGKLLRGRACGYSDAEHSKETITKMFVNKIGRFLSQPIVLNYDNSCAGEMMAVVRSYLDRFDCVNNHAYISVIGHPKFIEDADISELKKFCEMVKREHGELVDFINICDIPVKGGE